MDVTDPDFEAQDAFAPSGDRPEYYQSVDLFDSDWQLLYSIENEEMDELGIDRIAVPVGDGFLYSMLGNPYPRVVKYRVEFDPGRIP